MLEETGGICRITEPDAYRNRGILIQRVDDSEATIRHRMTVYEEQTQPVLDYYDDAGRLRRVDGLGSIEEVAMRVRAAAAEAK